jgi:molybdenum-dependent DNA-binding transcriptional regulator ModE
MLDLQQVESFRMVALTHNFTRAAAELGYSQSSVTLHIKALERELGAPLLERHRFSKTVQLLRSTGARWITPGGYWRWRMKRSREKQFAVGGRAGCASYE